MDSCRLIGTHSTDSGMGLMRDHEMSLNVSGNAADVQVSSSQDVNVEIAVYTEVRISWRATRQFRFLPKATLTDVR